MRTTNHVQVARLRGGETLTLRVPGVRDAVFAPGGREILISAASSDEADSIVSRRDARTGRVLASRTILGRVDRMVVSPPRRALTAVAGTDVVLLDSSSLNTRATLFGHELFPSWTGFTPHGGLAVTTAGNRAVRMWDAGTGALVAAAAGGGGAPFLPPEPAISPLQDQILIPQTAGLDVYACDVCGSTDRVLRVGRSLLTRGLTPVERRLYLGES